MLCYVSLMFTRWHCIILCFSDVHQEAQCAMGDACCKLQKMDDDTSMKVRQQKCYSGNFDRNIMYNII